MRYAIVCILLLFFAATPAVAQEPIQDLDAMQVRYRGLIDDYRAKEQQFTIAATQYANLRTLAAQEEAVQQTRTVMGARADVLLTYLELLQVSLQQKPGIELTRRDAVLIQLEALHTALSQHRGRVEIATDRLQIEEEAVYIQSQEKGLLQVTELAQALLKIGAMQSAVDQLVLTKEKADAYVASADISETTRLEKQRGSEELGRTIEKIRTSIAVALEEYDREAQRSSAGAIGPIKSVLAGGYRNLTTALSYVRELVR